MSESGRTFKNYRPTITLPHTHMICVKAVFFLQMGTGSMLCECALTVYIWQHKSAYSMFKTWCATPDVFRPHEARKSEWSLGCALLSSLLSYTASLWRSGCLGPSLFKKHVLFKEALTQHWTSKGRHKLAHIWGQNRSHLSSHCEDEEGG